MNASARSPIAVSGLALLSCWLAAATGTMAADPPAERFLDALRQREYYDIAVDYLEAMKERADCPADFKEVIDYEIGVTLLDAARRIARPSERETKLDAGTAAIQKFLAENPTHELAAEASSRIGQILLVRGAECAQDAERPGLPSEEQQAKRTQAREYYDQAETAFESAENRYYAAAKELEEQVAGRSSARVEEEFKQAFAEWGSTRLFLANVADQRGRTYEPGSQEFQEQLEAAAEKYHALFEKQGRHVLGLRARSFEGRVYRDLERYDEAVGVFREVLANQEQSLPFQRIKTQALVWLLETYLEPEVANYDKALEIADEWRETALQTEVTSPEGLEILLLAGRAAIEAARPLDPKDDRRKDLIRSARKDLQFVQRSQNSIRKEATNLLMDEIFGGVEAGTDESEPTTFEEALNKANLAWLAMLTANGQADQAKDPQKKAEFAAQAATARADCLKYCHGALDFADDSVEIDQLNSLRSLLTFLYFLDNRFYDAAVMGEFLAYRYPMSGGARKGAEIAVKAYRKLFLNERQASRDTSFETARMKGLAEYVATRWEGDAVADEAWLMLFDTAIDNQDIAKAIEYLEKLPLESGQRAAAELRLGQAYWSQYVREFSRDEGERLPQTELDALVEKAKQTLERGIDRMSKSVEAGEEPTYPLAFSVLSLAQILIDAGEAGEAVNWIDAPGIGPMTLVESGSPVVAENSDFQIDTYKAALRAYVGDQKLDRAERVMQKLEKLVGNNGGKGGARLTEIYVSLGRQLEDMLTRLRKEGKTDEVQRVSQGFETFLEKILRRDEGTSYRSLNWVAQTFFSLGAGLDPGSGQVPPKALEYYRAAGSAYYKLLKNNPADMPAGAEASIKLRLAICLRAMGEYGQALGLLRDLIEEKETRVEAQMETARTYQQFARANEKPGFYRKAILGGKFRTNGRDLIWGWNGIARRVSSLEEFRPVFFEAWYNIALCHMRYAQSLTGAEREEALERAEKDIVVTHKLYPSLGGPEWFEKYDSLLKTIRKFRGIDNPKGLRNDSKTTSVPRFRKSSDAVKRVAENAEVILESFPKRVEPATEFGAATCAHHARMLLRKTLKGVGGDDLAT